MIVIGLTGEKRGGKGAFTEIFRELLPEKKIVRMGFGDIIGDLLDILGKKKTRENMQELPIILIKGYSQPDVITRAMKLRIEKIGNDADIVILDGIRTWQDRKMLKGFPINFLVYVTASLETRYARARASSEKVGENALSLEEFSKQDNAEIEKLIPDIGATADFIVQNESTLDDYRRKIKIFCKYKIQTAE